MATQCDAGLSEDTAEDLNFAGYWYSITYSTGPAVLDTGSVASASDANITSSLKVRENQTYEWHVWPVDLAGNLGTELTGSTAVLSLNDTRCDHDATNDESQSIYTRRRRTRTLVSVTARTLGSGCKTISRYSLPGSAASSLHV